MQRKILIFLCVVTWIVIIFVWRTLFWTRTYDTTNMQMVSVGNYLQEQISLLSSEKVNESKKATINAMKTFNDKINQTVTSLDKKVKKLGEAVLQRHQKAKQALQVLSDGVKQNEEEKVEEYTPTTIPLSYHADPKDYIRKVIPTKVSLNSLDFVLSLNASGDVFVVNFFTCLNDYRTRGRDIRSSAFKNEMCIDSVEQPTGSDVELYECHGEGRNQAWALSNGFIKNYVHDICLRSADGFYGSSVQTATCDTDDINQKWRHENGAIMLGDDENDNKCLEVDITTKKLMIRACDSKKESQLWKL
ncbi:uncharacterized protein LOC113664301 [Pocillopora damicornis]|uniref:uncharacterized protein LOC113664301 n=1 Tax=Pocillopora damicornis TaxID=46731 RepID=UPI000F556722|nr:uncharacterized protein LOC113664301 [Pocillopora damicornis]